MDNPEMARSSEAPELDEIIVRRGSGRPTIVTLIALYEFFRAAFILLILLTTRFDPNAYLASRLDAQVLTYVVTRHDISTYANPLIMPVVAGLVFSMGLGLWLRKKWARNSLMIASGTSVVLWLRRFSLDWAFGQTTLKTPAGQQSVYAVILIDVLIFMCLAFYPDVAESFGKEDS